MAQEKEPLALAALAAPRAQKLCVFVVSDTHGSDFTYRRMLALCPQIDLAVHLGDIVSDAAALKKRLPAQTPLINVRGNCDVYNAAPDAATFTVGGVRMLAVHGHDDGVKYDLNNLYFHALEQNATVALYGHTHVPQVERQGGVWLVNPGSASRPRLGRPNTCALIEIRDGRAYPGIISL